MRIIRRLLVCVALLIVLTAVLLGLALTSPLQTWFAQVMLDRQKDVHGSIGSASAGFGKVEISDVRLEADYWELKLPSLVVNLPVTAAARDRNFAVRNLVAKGWILDLSLVPPPDTPQATSTVRPAASGTPGETPRSPDSLTAQKVEEVFRGIVGGWQLPADVSLDGVDLEGDVIVAASADRDPVQLHVVIKGGGLASGHEGVFEFHVEGRDPWQRANSLVAQGQLNVDLKNPRTFDRAAIKADLTARGGIFAQNFTVTAGLAAARTADGESCTVSLDRDGRSVVAVTARFSTATHRVAGEWKIDGRDTDLAPLLPDHPLPALVMSGSGRFEADTAFTQVHVLGQLEGTGSHWGVLSPAVDRMGEAAFTAQFDLLRAGQSVRIERLEMTVAGARPVAVVRLLQPFEFEPDTGNLKMTDPQGDWLDFAFSGLPLEWLPLGKSGIALSGGVATGRIMMRADSGGMALRSDGPLTATNISLRTAGKMAAQQLDLSLVLHANRNAEGWEARWTPFTVTHDGRRLAESEGSVSRASDADQPTMVKGKWSADLVALGSQLSGALGGLLPKGAASGDFSASIGGTVDFDGTGTLTGQDPAHALSGSLHVEGVANGPISFSLPLKIGTGKKVTEISAEGEWQGTETGNQINAKITSDDADWKHLRLLAAPLATAAGYSLSEGLPGAATGSAEPAGGTDREPFWGNWAGMVALNFGVLRADGRVIHNVGGSLELEPGSIHLVRGLAQLAPNSEPAQLEGSLVFDAAAEFPYRLTATASFSNLDPAPLIVPVEKQTDPVLEGHFAVNAKVSGDGRTLRDLVGRTREDYHLTSANGIIRLLRISVADAFPEDAPVSTSSAALDTAGSLVNRLMGNGKRSMDSGEKKVGATAEAVLNFTGLIAELAYDRIDVTAVRGSDGTLRLTAIEMVAADERLTGAGQIAGSEDQPLRDRPLTVDLKLGVRGDIAGVAAKAGLLGTQKDELGYTALAQPLHFGGSLGRLDSGAWHDVLAKAATRPPAEDKKTAGKKPAK